MKRTLSTSCLLAAALLMLSGCSSSDDLSRATTQEDFGVRMARMNLWREAMFRFQRAVEIDPNDALARSNLAVAYEATGDFEAALREYREAMRLDRSNQYIQKNYSRFVEFTQRNRKRQQPSPARTATAGDSSSGVTPASVPVNTTPSDPAGPDTANPPQPEPVPPKAPDGGF